MLRNRNIAGDDYLQLVPGSAGGRLDVWARTNSTMLLAWNQVICVCSFHPTVPAKDLSMPDALQQRSIGWQACADEIDAGFHLGPNDQVDRGPSAIDKGIFPEKGCEADNGRDQTAMQISVASS